MSQKVDRRRINGPLEPSVRPLFLTVEEELNRKETALSIFPKNNVRLDGRQPLLHRPICTPSLLLDDGLLIVTDWPLVGSLEKRFGDPS